MHLGRHGIAGEHRDERAAGWVAVAVIVGPRNSKNGFGPAQGGLRHHGLVLHGITGRPCAGGSRFAHEGGSRSRQGNPTAPYSPRRQAVGPHIAADASQPSISATCCRSLAVEHNPRHVATPPRLRRILHESSAWRPAVGRTRQSRARPGPGQTAAASLEAPERSPQPPYSGPVSKTRYEGLSLGVGTCPSSPLAAAMRWASSSVVIALSSCPASVNAAPRLV